MKIDQKELNDFIAKFCRSTPRHFNPRPRTRGDSPGIVCDNLAFSGEVSLSRRHTTHIERDLPQVVNRAVAKLTELRGSQDQRIEAYKTKRINDRAAHDLLIRV